MFPKRLRVDQRLCPHCNNLLSYKTYRAHKRLYYNEAEEAWRPASRVDKASDVEEDPPSEYPSDDTSMGVPPSLSPCSVAEDMNECYESHDDSPPHSEAALSDSDVRLSSLDCKVDICFLTSEKEVWSDEEVDDVYVHNSCQVNDQQESPPFSPRPQPQASSTQHFGVLIEWFVSFFLLLQAHFHLPDHVMNFIFVFMKAFFVVLGKLYAPLLPMENDLPTILYMAKKSYACPTPVTFQKMPVCKSCGVVRHFSECIQSRGSQTKARLCSTVLDRSKHSCKGALLKTVELVSGRSIFYPLLTYCYLNLQVSLQSLLLDPAFTSQTALWKTRRADECLKDVYDGRIWKTFLDSEGVSFLNDDNGYAFMINVDWFQPYKHLNYSVGAIYLSVFNLPRRSRYKLQNICLIGIIPGLREPELNINGYIDPLVDELLQFWRGIELEVHCGMYVCRQLVRCAVICCSCDLPAGRKLCGFLGHSAHFGCSKCKKYFPSSTHGLDYSGFNRQTWVKCTNESHRSDVAKLSGCKTKTALRKMESELGCRYSSLLKLPYFDAPTMLVIDPMHCLFLGLAKHFVKKIFIGHSILSQGDFDTIQRRVSELAVPSDIGRIPNKIQHSFYSFTADQFKTWVLHYSIICLHGLQSTDYLECWRHFLVACRYLCKPTLKPNDVIIADALLLKFCTRTETLYGNDVITPNMHMSCHIKDCTLDYGPLNHFWLFAFERFNGILGHLPNNNRSIENQMMKRFISDTQIMRIALPNEYDEEFKPLLNFQQRFVGTVESCSDVSPSDQLQLPHSAKRCVFNSSELDDLKKVFLSLYTTCNEIEICFTFTKYPTINMEGIVYGSAQSRAKNTSIVLAQLEGEACPARIEYFARVSISIDRVSSTVVMVSLRWFKNHPLKDSCGKPVTI